MLESLLSCLFLGSAVVIAGTAIICPLGYNHLRKQRESRKKIAEHVERISQRDAYLAWVLVIAGVVILLAVLAPTFL